MVTVNDKVGTNAVGKIVSTAFSLILAYARIALLFPLALQHGDAERVLVILQKVLKLGQTKKK